MYEQVSSNIWRSRLLIAFFIVFIALMGYVFALVYDNPFIAIIAVIFAIVTSIGSYYHSDQIIVSATRARPAEKSEFPHYVNSVEGLALAAGLPCPRAYVIDDPAPNAFATGRDPEHAIICVTTGLLKMMDREELEGVVSHEMSHVKNYDIRFMMLVAVLVGVAAMLADLFWRSGRFGGFRRRGRGGGQAQAIIHVIGLILTILAPFSAALIQAAISRQREYLADSSGALLARYPDGLADALEKIAADPNALRSANKATAHLFIANPLKDQGGAMNSLFDTHPPINERVRRLRAM